jgi:hypothetical protein
MVRFNRVIIGGNLVRDPEIRFLPSGLSVTNFTVAVSEDGIPTMGRGGARLRSLPNRSSFSAHPGKEIREGRK